MASLQDILNHSGRRNGKAIEKGNAAASSFYTLVANGRMPKGPNKVPQQQVDLIKQWIDGGANP